MQLEIEMRREPSIETATQVDRQGGQSPETDGLRQKFTHFFRMLVFSWHTVSETLVWDFYVKQ